MRLTVLVPTYRRPQDLARCLRALAGQHRAPDEVIVTVRDHDAETWAYLEAHPAPISLRAIRVEAPGVIAAMNAGLEAATGAIVCFTDDDAAPHPDWLARIEAHFAADARLGVLGGRDVMYEDGVRVEGRAEVVGRIQFFGRHIGHHHLGHGLAREVDTIQGANMSYRRAALAARPFDERLRAPDQGVEMHNELGLSLTLKRAGWKVVYDPAVQVDHLLGKRYGGGQRKAMRPEALVAEVHNETLILLEHLPPAGRVAFALWALAVGTRRTPGLVQWLRLLPAGPRAATVTLAACLRGRLEGFGTWRAGRGVARVARFAPAMAQG